MSEELENINERLKAVESQLKRILETKPRVQRTIQDWYGDFNDLRDELKHFVLPDDYSDLFDALHTLKENVTTANEAYESAYPTTGTEEETETP